MNATTGEAHAVSPARREGRKGRRLGRRKAPATAGPLFAAFPGRSYESRIDRQGERAWTL